MRGKRTCATVAIGPNLGKAAVNGEQCFQEIPYVDALTNHWHEVNKILHFFNPEKLSACHKQPNAFPAKPLPFII